MSLQNGMTGEKCCEHNQDSMMERPHSPEDVWGGVEGLGSYTMVSDGQ